MAKIELSSHFSVNAAIQLLMRQADQSGTLCSFLVPILEMVSDQEIVTQVNLEQGKRAGISKMMLHGMVGIVNPLCVFSSGVDI